MVARRTQVDGRDLDEFDFPLHDAAHCSIRYLRTARSQVPPEIVNAMDRDILSQIEKSTLSTRDFEIQHYIHHFIFHGKSGFQFQYQEGLLGQQRPRLGRDS